MGLPTFTPAEAPASDRAARLAACRACPELRRGAGVLPDRCARCGCFVVAKTAVPGQSCPVGKW